MAATAEVQALCDKVRADIEAQAGSEVKEFQAINFKQQVGISHLGFVTTCKSMYVRPAQVVAGMNFFVKVHIGDERFVHVRIYRDLRDNVSLHGVVADKTRSDAVEYFDARH